jgi:signal transduction histidine kinase
MQIRTRLTLQFIFVVTFIILVAFGLIYYSSSNFRRHELYKRLENKAITSAEIFISVEQIDSTMLSIFDRTQRDKLPFENVTIYNSKNREIYTSNDSLRFNADIALLDEIRQKRRKEFNIGGREILGIRYDDKPASFVVFASATDIFGFSKLSNLANTLLILFLGIVSIVAITGWLYAGRALKPLSRVVDEVDRMRPERLDARLNKTVYNDEIGRLIITFNTLLDRIEEAFRVQKLFLSGASHELRNPLTTITSQLQVALLRERSHDEYRSLLSSLLDDIRKLNRTTIDLLEYARLSYERDVSLSDIRIDDVLWHSAEHVRKNNPQYSVNIRFSDLPEDPSALVAKGNEALLTIVFINIIDNACKFSQDHRCDISFATGSDKITVMISDNGIGMDEEQLKFIFEPFYRGNSTAEVKGHGIGLALTRRIVQLHLGTIDVDTSPKKGTRITIGLNRQ